MKKNYKRDYTLERKFIRSEIEDLERRIDSALSGNRIGATDDVVRMRKDVDLLKRRLKNVDCNLNALSRATNYAYDEEYYIDRINADGYIRGFSI